MSERLSKTSISSNEVLPVDVIKKDRWRDRIFATWPLLISGVSVGIAGVLLSVMGNPQNSGICVSCFMENIAGSLGFHADQRMMYLRPEISGFLLGAFFISLLRGEFRVRGGGAPLLRFITGFFLMVGCSIFIGCPIKMALRLSAGDLTAVAGAVGLGAGVFLGVAYLKAGFRLPRSAPGTNVGGYVMPLAMILMLVALAARPAFIQLSTSGPASLHPAWIYSLAFGLAIGALAQHSRFCITGSMRNFLLSRDWATLLGLAGLILSALIAALSFGRFNLGINDQPGAHLNHLWSFMGLFMVGFASILINGCPFRQLILSGEGNLDAGLTVLGMLFGGGAVYTWGIRSTISGPTLNGKIAVVAGLIFLFFVANSCRKKV